IAGRSSWMSEYVWISSSAQAAGSASELASRQTCAVSARSGPALAGAVRWRATASAEARASAGRSRLPPANTLYRIASLTRGGHAGGLGRYCSRASSTRARACSRNAERESPCTFQLSIRIVGGQRRRRRLELAAVAQDLDAAFRLFEPCVTEPGELHAALVERQRLLERQVALFKLLDDRLELGDRGFEVLDGGVRHLLGVLPGGAS